MTKRGVPHTSPRWNEDRGDRHHRTRCWLGRRRARAVASPDEGRLRRERHQDVTTNGGLAAVLVVAGRLRGGVRAAGHEGITLFAVRRGADGFSTGRRLQKVGWRSSGSREFLFDDCFVAEQDVTAEPGRDFTRAGAGCAHRAALDYAKERVAFGSPIPNYQSVRHVLSGLHAELEAPRLLTYTAATRVGGTPSDGRPAVSMAKLVIARLANRVADAAVQVFGGYRYLEESPIALHYRDARILRYRRGPARGAAEPLPPRRSHCPVRAPR